MVDRLADLTALFAGEVSVRWLLTLLHFLWQGAAVAAIAAVVGCLLRGGAARGRYALYAAALLALPVCVAVTFCIVDVPAGPVAVVASAGLADVPVGPAEPASRDPSARPPAAAGPVSAARAPGLPESARGAAGRPAATGGAPEPPSRVLPAGLAVAAPWIAAAYVVGVGCFLLRLLAGLWGGHRLRRPAVPVTDAKLLESIADQARRVGLQRTAVVAWCERIAVPTVVGLLRPIVLLPMQLASGLDADDLAAVIRHELAHIRRYDLWTNLLQRIIESLLFFHPAVWFLGRRLSAEREVCCDEMVVSSGCEPMRYAGALLRLAELCAAARTPGSLAMAAAGGGRALLVRRIERSMNWGRTPPLRLTRAGVAGLLAALAALVVVPGVAHTWAQPAAEVPGAEPAAARTKPAPAPPSRGGAKTLREPALRLREPERLSAVQAVAFDRGGRELVVASTWHQATIRRWDLDGGKLLREVKLAGDKPGRSFMSGTVTLSGDRRRVVAVTDEYVGIWETATGDLRTSLPLPRNPHRRFTSALACTPDLSVVACLARTIYEPLVIDGYVVIWDVPAGKVLRTVTHKHAGYGCAIALSPDGTRLATSGGDVCIWETHTGKLLRRVAGDGAGRARRAVLSLQFSPDGKRLAMGDLSGVTLVEVASGERLARLEGAYRYSSGRAELVFSRDGGFLARLGTWQTRRVVPIWCTRTGKKRFVLHTDSQGGCFSDDGRRFAVGLSGRRAGVGVWQLSGQAAEAARDDPPTAAPAPATVAKDGPYRGRKAAALIDALKPAWGRERLGIRYGAALNTTRRRFSKGQRIPLAVFLRNVSDQPLRVDVRPGSHWRDLPKIVDAKGTAIAIDRRALLGGLPHYRDKLAPGEAYGPFLLSVGLAANPRPGRRDWHPYIKRPPAGTCGLTHAMPIEVTHLYDGAESETVEFTTGKIAFEIAGGDAVPERALTVPLP